jgi:hypothetical protein
LPQSYFFAGWRNINRYFVLPESSIFAEWRNINSFFALPQSLSPRRMAKHQPLLRLCPNLISSPDGETSTAALFCLNLYFLDGCRNNYRCSVYARIFNSSPYRRNLLSLPGGAAVCLTFA